MALRICPGCDEMANLVRHHRIPRRDSRFVKGMPNQTTAVCRPCHDLIHKRWGPGGSFIGPTDEDELIEKLRVLIMFRDA